MTTEAEALRRKKSIRAGHRASATRILGHITTALADTPDPDRLALLKLTLNEKLDTLRKFDSEIIELTPEDGLEGEIQQSDEYKERMYDAVTKIDRVVGTLRTPPATAVARTSSPAATTHERRAKAKLPKLSLPHFNGNLMKWTSFWDSYESAIHNNDELTDVDKFNYLRSLLERTAYDAIAGLTLSSANYREAIEILQKRFGNKQLIIAKHMETLLNVEAVSSDQNLKDLRRLYDNTESHIRSLKSLGVESTSYGAMLSSVLLTKLPPDVRLIVSRKISSTDPDMDSILRTFEEELVARERASNPSHSQPRRTQERGRYTASALFSRAQEQENGVTCCYCQQPHSLMDCTSATSPSARKQLLKTSGRCFNCLRKGHLGRKCRSPSRCQRCGGRHHTSICEVQVTEQPRRPGQPPPSINAPSTRLDPEAPSYTPTQTTNTFCSDKGRTVLLQTARAVVHNPSRPQISIEVRLLFDSGSQKSYITERAQDLLSLEPSGEQRLSIVTFGSNREQVKVCPIVGVGMCLKGYPPMSLSLYVVPTICEPLIGQPITACVQQNKQFIGLDLADYSDGNSSLHIDMLIGSDYYWDLVTGSVCRGDGGLTAVHTKLGWVLSGPAFARDSAQCSMNLTTTHVLHVDSQRAESAGLEEQLRSFWELESLGIHQEEKTLYDDFTSNVAFQDGRYKVSLPWKEFHDPLPDNYQLSLKRLRGLLCRLKQDPIILKEYDRTIKDQLDKGIIEVVPMGKPIPHRVHYLPHHAVVRQDKTTTKLRIVYDASAKSDGPSLNDCLYKGPRFNQLILDLLLRFRSYRVALTADVEKAFLMITIDNSDRDVLRFIWIDDIEKDKPELQVFRFTRVVFGVSSSPFLLNATIKFHLERYLETNEAIVRRLLQYTYVDDIVTGAETEEAAFELYTQAKDLFRRGGFNLRKFSTNSGELTMLKGYNPPFQKLTGPNSQAMWMRLMPRLHFRLHHSRALKETRF